MKKIVLAVAGSVCEYVVDLWNDIAAIPRMWLARSWWDKAHDVTVALMAAAGIYWLMAPEEEGRLGVLIIGVGIWLFFLAASFAVGILMAIVAIAWAVMSWLMSSLQDWLAGAIRKSREMEKSR